MVTDEEWDCIVVGSGHAGSCAALSAVQNGCKRVLVIDKCPPEWIGGNGFFTAGAHRTVHSGLTSTSSPATSLIPILCSPYPYNFDKIDIAPYTESDFELDIQRLSSNQSDPAMVKAVVQNSRSAIGWLADYVGIPFVLSFHRQAYEVDGRFKFWGGMALSVRDGGKGLIEAHGKALRREGVPLWFETKATEILLDGEKVVGLAIEKGEEHVVLKTSAVVLAAGGFEASKEMRIKHLGKPWGNARVRGTPYNTGDGFRLAQQVGAKFTSNWSLAGCHSTAWDAASPADSGDRILTNQYTKSGYPLGLILNVLGQRFVDEGEDMRNYTYAKFGRRILEQKHGVAFQVFDAKVIDWLRKEEYADEVVPSKITASSLEELANKLNTEGLEDENAFLYTIQEYNASVEHFKRAAIERGDVLKWDPAIKDGLSTYSSLTPPKSNWAQTIANPPFVAVKVACGITFTFGGLIIDPDTAAVVASDNPDTDTLGRSTSNKSLIEGLFCTGEMVGGLFYGNYPGGSGLTAGAVFGYKAGEGAARLKKEIKRPIL